MVQHPSLSLFNPGATLLTEMLDNLTELYPDQDKDACAEGDEHPHDPLQIPLFYKQIYHVRFTI